MLLTVEGSEMNERILMLDNIEKATCPVCEQHLTEMKREQMLSDLINERDLKRQEYRTITERVAEIADIMPKLMSDLEVLNNKDNGKL